MLLLLLLLLLRLLLLFCSHCLSKTVFFLLSYQQFYSKTGKCKFGANCKFHHPKDLQIPASGQNVGTTEQLESSGKDNGAGVGDLVPAKMFVPFTPALLHNSKGLPVRLVGSA